MCAACRSQLWHDWIDTSFVFLVALATRTASRTRPTRAASPHTLCADSFVVKLSGVPAVELNVHTDLTVNQVRVRARRLRGGWCRTPQPIRHRAAWIRRHALCRMCRDGARSAAVAVCELGCS